MTIDKNDVYAALEARHGRELQKKISKTSVAVCGLGGLGSNIAVTLARLGIGKLIIFDFDMVELSNINRQQYYFKNIGSYKTDAMCEIIKDIMPFTDVEAHNMRIDENNLDMPAEADIVCEAFDKPEIKAMLVNGIAEKFPGKFIVAASGMSGKGNANEITTRKISEHFYLCGDGKSDVFSDGTIFATRASLCAAHQAHAVLQIISERNF